MFKWNLPRSANTLLGLLCLLNLLNYIDRQVVTALLELIRVDLGGTDAQMGLVGSAFILTYSLLPPLFGWIGDRISRTRLLAASASVWCAATAFCGLVGSFGQLALARAFVGIGEASYMTNSPSLLSDLFPAKLRGVILSVFYAMAPIGAALGVALAGIIASAYGWRSACFMVALPGLALAVLLYFSNDPPRGRFDPGGANAAPPLRVAVRMLARNAPFLTITFALAAQIFTQNAIEYWLPTVLMRDKGIALTTATGTYAAMTLIAGIGGPIIGALLGDGLSRRTPQAYYYVAGGAALMVVLPLIVIARSTEIVPLFAGVAAEALFGNMATGLVIALAMNAVVPGVRASAMAVLLTIGHLLGDAISWPLVGYVSTALQGGQLEALSRLGAQLGVAAQSHLTMALATVTVPAIVVAAALYFLAARVSQSNRR